jgi:hypothetical protein
MRKGDSFCDREGTFPFPVIKSLKDFFYDNRGFMRGKNLNKFAERLLLGSGLQIAVNQFWFQGCG